MEVPRISWMDGLFHGKYQNGWFGGTPISGNHHMYILYTQGGCKATKKHVGASRSSEALNIPFIVQKATEVLWNTSTSLGPSGRSDNSDGMEMSDDRQFIVGVLVHPWKRWYETHDDTIRVWVNNPLEPQIFELENWPRRKAFRNGRTMWWKEHLFRYLDGPWS